MDASQKYLDDLKEIREIMNKSSRFISLSGMSGITTGLIALIGAYAAYYTVYSGQNYLSYRKAMLASENLIVLLSIVMVVLISSILAGVFLTNRKAKKEGQQIWDIQSKRLIVNLLIPLGTGGILCLILLFKGYIGLLAPFTLIFYGLALVNASKYTLTEVRSLGLFEVGLGLLATHFIGFGLIFWSIGFGLLHIVYGIIMHFKYGS